MARIWQGHITKALVVENPSTILDGLLEAEGVQVLRLAHIPSEDDMISIIQEHQIQVVFKRSKVRITRKMIERCPSLLVVQLCCIGDDSVDKEACAEHGIMVFNDPISNGRSVVELVIGNLIALSRRLFETNAECREGVWNKNNVERFEVQGKVLGVLGLGNIGRAVARTAQALGMQICFFDTRQVSIELGKELGWTFCDSIDSLFQLSDCVTVHLSAKDVLGHSNQGLITSEHFAKLGAQRPKGQRIFINFARGFVHTPEDLIAAIESKSIRFAAVDVYPHEPRTQIGWTNPYLNCPQVAVYPHIGASTQEAQPRIAQRVCETFTDFSKMGMVRDTPFQPRLLLQLSEVSKQGKAILAVCHSTVRGTKKAIDEVIFQAGLSNLSSMHKDFDELGFAYDLALLDGVLSEEDIQSLVANAAELTGQQDAIRSVRQVSLV